MPCIGPVDIPRFTLEKQYGLNRFERKVWRALAVVLPLGKTPTIQFPCKLPNFALFTVLALMNDLVVFNAHMSLSDTILNLLSFISIYSRVVLCDVV